MPVDFELKDEASVKYDAYPASKIHDRVAHSGVRLNIVILDACRNNGFTASRSASAGLAAMNAARGSFIAFSTAPGSTASDNPRGRNGLFTSYLLDTIRKPGLTLDEVFNQVRQGVYQASENKQLAWTSSSVIGDFYFLPAGATRPRAAARSGVRQGLATAAGPPGRSRGCARRYLAASSAAAAGRRGRSLSRRLAGSSGRRGRSSAQTGSPRLRGTLQPRQPPRRASPPGRLAARRHGGGVRTDGNAAQPGRQQCHQRRPPPRRAQHGSTRTRTRKTRKIPREVSGTDHPVRSTPGCTADYWTGRFLDTLSAPENEPKSICPPPTKSALNSSKL